MRHRKLLSVDLVRINTSNPPGNEAAVDERIALASLEQGTDMLTRVVQSVAAR